jgi:hypothetical protein
MMAQLTEEIGVHVLRTGWNSKNIRKSKVMRFECLNSLMQFIYLFSFLLCWVGVHCGIYKCSYNISNISYLSVPLHCFPSYPPPPSPGIVSTDIIFPCILHVYPVFAPNALLHHFTTPFSSTGNKPPGRTCSTFLFSNFV